MQTSTTTGVSDTAQAAPALTPTTVLTAQELAPILKMHPVTLLRWAREGRIPNRRLSARKIVFLLSEVNAWLASDSTPYTECAIRAAQQ